MGCEGIRGRTGARAVGTSYPHIHRLVHPLPGPHPRYRRLISTRRGGLTTNGIHATLPPHCPTDRGHLNSTWRGLASLAGRKQLATMKTLDGFDFSFQPSLDRNRILSLAELAFIDRADVVHLLGPPGTGKSFGDQPRDRGRIVRAPGVLRHPSVAIYVSSGGRLSPPPPPPPLPPPPPPPPGRSSLGGRRS